MKISNQAQNQRISSINDNIHKIDKKHTERLSTGKKINHAKDDPAGLAISDKMQSLIAGLGKGVNNTYDMQNAIKTADGSLSNISNGLQRVRELSIQASSSILNDSDKAIIQQEIDVTLSGINNIASQSQFNGQNLLDGSFKDKNVASNTDGSGTSVSLDSATLKDLGLDGFSVMGNTIDIKAIDSAIETISDARVKIGAQINRFDHTISSNETTALNTISAKSRIEDADMAKESMLRSTNKALSQYGIFAQKNEAQTKYNMLNILF